ncbi:hypothetical protein EPUS_02533 [Endocarpon pusillum Z07020]|uniref:Ketoreductase domain-containing protein n=1 Tax=Endocarpon pusillum (strain Z07020 / HMAS-L-300199) TaxID=1263415 RepID=U1G0F0_ENDPU|nr:uncharacterized protein EPUS_02533 [Endocarpon pusillum Z07020]ERF70667.1 hypothetical protein EPUS_02533 [Endocarpon pusillum Z07020]
MPHPGYQCTSSTNLSSGSLSYRQHDGKFGIVTGGSRGIGAAIAENLAAKGCSLLLVYTSDTSREPIEALCKSLAEQHSVRCVAVQADLSGLSRSVAHIVSTARNNFSHPKTGRFQIDILINNAGIAGNKMLNDQEKGPIEEEQFHKMYDVNVLAPLLLTQACEPYLPTDRSGRIVNISSVSSAIGYSGQSIYAGTKAALEAMTRSWSRELAERCTVNCVNPGPVWGDMYENAGPKFWAGNQPFVDAAPLTAYHGEIQVKAEAGEGQEEKFDKTVKEGMGGRRPGFPREIAGVVGMLCSQESGWTTGSVISGNGGMVMST